MREIESKIDSLICSRDYMSIIEEIEILFDEELGLRYLDLLQQAIENEGITGGHIVGWSQIHNRPHWIFNNPKSVIRRVENRIEF